MSARPYPFTLAADAHRMAQSVVDDMNTRPNTTAVLLSNSEGMPVIEVTRWEPIKQIQVKLTVAPFDDV